MIKISNLWLKFRNNEFHEKFKLSYSININQSHMNWNFILLIFISLFTLFDEKLQK